MRCIVVGSDDRYAINCVRSVLDCGHTIVAYWTGHSPAPDQSGGVAVFGVKEKESAQIRKLLADKKIPYRRIEKPFKPGLHAALDLDGDVDAILTCGSMIIYPRDFIERVDGKLINFHPALLPHYKGPVPLHALIANEEADIYGGMTMHVVSPKIDEGPIIGQRHLPLSRHRSINEWYDAMHLAVKSLIEDELPRYLDGSLVAVPQEPGSGSYFREGDVHMSIKLGLSVAQIEQQLRISPMKERFPKAYLPYRKKVRRFVVRGPVTKLGAPTGAPVEVNFTSIVFDATDARVRLKHLTKPAQLLEDIKRRLGLPTGA